MCFLKLLILYNYIKRVFFKSTLIYKMDTVKQGEDSGSSSSPVNIGMDGKAIESDQSANFKLEVDTHESSDYRKG